MGLFDNFNPNLGWLASVLPQQGQFRPIDGLFGGPGLPQSAMGGGYGGGVFPSQPDAGMPQPNQPQQQAQQQPMQAYAMAQPQQQPMQAPVNPFMPQQAGMGDRLQAGLAGFANAKSPMQAFGNLIGGITTGQRSDPQGMMLQQQQSTYGALVNSGVPAAVAQAAALNPEVLKTIAPQLYTKPTFGVIGQNQMGVNQYGFINPTQETVKPAAVGGAPIGAQGGIDPNLTGEPFLKAITADPTLGPGKAQMVKAIAEGRQPYPSGFLLKTPFGQWLTTAVGQYEPGLDATLIGQRATFNKQMGSATPASVGGQKTLMGTSLGHLAEVADSALEVSNGNGFGIAPIAHLANTLKNTIGTEAAAKANALNEKVDRFSGEVGKLYSGSAGGGVAERDQTRSRFGASQSAQELAAGLEASRDLIKSKLLALENQQDQIFGPNAKNRVDFLGQNGRDALAKIDAAIAKLRSGTASTTAQPQTVNPYEAEMRRRGLLK